MFNINFRVENPGLDKIDFKKAIHKGMLKGMLQAEATSKTDYLSGPRPQKLDVITNRLRGSVKGKASIRKNSVAGWLGSNVEYAAQHEYGETVRIPSHSRTITQAFGRPITPTTFTVKAHDAKFPERPFLQPAIEDTIPDIQTFIRDAITEAFER